VNQSGRVKSGSVVGGTFSAAFTEIRSQERVPTRRLKVEFPMMRNSVKPIRLVGLVRGEGGSGSASGLRGEVIVRFVQNVNKFQYVDVSTRLIKR
jgi:hypothetical protein